MPIVKDFTAPYIEDKDLGENGSLTRARFDKIVAGAFRIIESEDDNDSETWYLTPAGQIVRVCGLEQNRRYIVDADEAFDMLNGWAEDEVLRQVWTAEELADLLPE